jgi:hypothetical protein
MLKLQQDVVREAIQEYSRTLSQRIQGLHVSRTATPGTRIGDLATFDLPHQEIIVKRIPHLLQGAGHRGLA